VVAGAAIGQSREIAEQLTDTSLGIERENTRLVTRVLVQELMSVDSGIARIDPRQPERRFTCR
jgi:hypothetical protein